MSDLEEEEKNGSDARNVGGQNMNMDMDGQDDHLTSPMELLMAEHRKQRKDLQSKLTNMKHSVAKGDKKRRKEVMAEVERLENELKERQKKEIAELEANSPPENIATTEEGSHSNNHQPTESSTALEQQQQQQQEQQDKSEQSQRVSKAQKRRERKADQHRKHLEALQEDQQNAPFAPGNIERGAIKNVLSDRGLALYEIAPDGDCLYSAIAHQLSLMNLDSNEISMDAIRHKASSYMLSHKDDFLPFLTDQSGEPINEFNFEDYCHRVDQPAMNGGDWGGEPELRALSNALERSIIVIQPEGRCINFGEEFQSKKPLTITFHRNAFALGEHYNSTIPKPSSSSQESSFS